MSFLYVPDSLIESIFYFIFRNNTLLERNNKNITVKMFYGQLNGFVQFCQIGHYQDLGELINEVLIECLCK